MSPPPEKHKLHALCPYFAMFPHTFARAQILEHSRPDGVVLDPFSGRGTTLLEGLLLERQAIGIDVNPVAACVTGAKARVPDLVTVNIRLDELQRTFESDDQESLEEEALSLPLYFRRAFYFTTLREILFLRRHLDWKMNSTDCFLSALVLGSLHGEMDRSPSYFSNQLPRTISPKQTYSLAYWDRNGLWPKKKNTFEILSRRASLRYMHARPSLHGTSLLLDVRKAAAALPLYAAAVDLVVTSPPYLNVTNYEEDQWLRLWFLGGQPHPTYGIVSKNDRHTRPDKYWRFLLQAWVGIAPLLKRGAIIVCRIGGKGLNSDNIIRSLTATVRASFPDVSIVGEPVVTLPSARQTDNFRPGTQRRPEIDVVLQVS